MTTYTQGGSKSGWFGSTSYPTFENSVATYIGKVGSGGTVNITDCTLAGTGVRNIQHDKQGGTNKKYSGAVIGNIENGTVNVTRFDMEWLADWGTVAASNLDGNDGLFYGATGSSGHIYVYDLYYNSNSVRTWVAGDNENWNAYIAYDPASVSISFDKANPGNVIFKTQFAEIDSSDLLYSINTGSTETKVYSVLAADGTDKVAGNTAYVSVPASGYNTSSVGGFTLKNMTVGSEATVTYDYDAEQSVYTATKVYDAQNISAPTVTVNGAEVAGAWNGNGVNVGTYDFTLIETDAAVGDYQYVVRGDKYVFIDEATGTSHKLSYQSKVLKYTVTPADLQLTFSNTADIVYKDNIDTVKGKFTVSVADGTLYGNIDAWDISSAMVGEVAYDATTEAGSVVTVTVDQDSIVLSDGNGNYNITWQDTSAQSTVQKLVMSGSFSGLDSLVYNAQSQKTAVFTVDGLGAEEITYKYTAKDGIDEIDVVNAGEYTVTATATDPSIELSGNSTDFTVTPKEVAIVPQDKEATYGGLAFTEYESLFTAPEGLGSDGTLAISASVAEGVEIKNVGKYTVTATLADASGNYTAEQVTATYTVNKAQAVISVNDEVDRFKSYDGIAFADYTSLFNEVDGVNGEKVAITASAGVDVTVKNAGEYTITATIADDNYYAGQVDVTYTVNKAEVTISVISATKEKTFDNAEFTAYDTLFTAPYPVEADGNTPLDLKYTVSGAGEQILNAGVYTITATLADTVKNYTAASASVTYTVNAKKVEKPAGETYIATGEEIVFINGTDDYGVSGETSGTDAGQYNVTVSLKDKENTTWSDGSVDDLTLVYEIIDAPSASEALVKTAEELDAALADENIVLITIGADFDYDKALTISRNVEIDLNGHVLTVTSKAYKKTDGTYLNTITVAADVVIKGNGELKVVCGKASKEDDELFSSTLARVTYIEEGAKLSLLDGVTYVSENESCYPVEVAGMLVINDATMRFRGTSSYGAIYVNTDGVTVDADNSDFYIEEDSKTANIVKVNSGLTDTNVAFDYVDVTATNFNNNLSLFYIMSGTAHLDHITATATTKYAKTVQITSISSSFDETPTVLDLTNSLFTVNYTEEASTSKLSYFSPFNSSGGYNVQATYSGNTLEYNASDVPSSGYFYTFMVSKGQYDIINNKITVSMHTSGTVSVIFANLNYVRNVTFVGNEISITNVDEYAKKGITFYSVSSTSASTYGNSVFDIKGNTVILEDSANVKLLNAKPTDVINVTSDEQGKSNTFDMVATNAAGNFTFASSLTGNMTIENSAFNTSGFTTRNVLDISSSKTGVEADIVDALFAEESNNTFSEEFTEILVGVAYENTVTTSEGTTRYYYGKSGNVFAEFGADGVTQNVKLLADMTSAVDMENVAGNITFDLNGHSIVAKQVMLGDPLFALNIDIAKTASAVNISIVNSTGTRAVLGTEEGADNAYGIYIRYQGADAGGTLNVSISNVNVTSTQSALVTNGTDYGATITATNCSFNGVNAGAYLPGEHDVTLNDCEFSGDTGIYVKSGTLDVNGCTVTAVGEYGAPEYSGSGFAASGSAIVVDACNSMSGDGGYRGNLNVSIANSTLESVNGYGIELVGTNPNQSESGDDFTNLTAIESYQNFFNTAEDKGFNDNMNNKVSEDNVTIVKNSPEVSVTVTEGTYYTSTEIANIGIEATASFGDKVVTGIVSWDEGQILTADEAEYNWTFTPDDTDNYEAVTGKSHITVIAVELESIDVVFDAGEDVIYSSAKVDSLKKYLTVSGINNDGSTIENIEDYELSGIIEKGVCIITVKVGDITDTFDVTVEEALVTKIEITELPTKTEYDAFEDFNAEGMIVTATYEDGNIKEITNYTIDGGESLRYGTDKVTVRFGTFSAEAAITVNKIDYDMSGVTFGNKTVTYNGETQIIEIVGALPIGKDGVQITVTYSGGITDVGSAEITATFATESVNYNVPAAMKAMLTVEPREVTIIWCEDEFTYNGEVQTVTASYNDVNGDSVVLTVTISDDKTFKNADDYTAVASLANGESNYVLPEQNSKNYRMNKLAVSVKADDAEMTYGGKVPTLGWGYAEGSAQFVEADGIVFTVTTDANSLSPVGNNYKTEVTELGELDNYTVSYATGTMTVTPKALTFSGYKAVGREYTGDKAITLTGGALSGIVKGDNVTFTCRGEMNTANAGVNTVTVYIVLTGDDAGNYTVTEPATTTVTITPATLTVVWGEQLEFVYNGNVQAPTAILKGVVYGDSVTLDVTGGGTNAGDYTAKAIMSEENGNYVLSNDTIDFTIARAESIIDVSGVETEYTYNGQMQTVTGATLNHSETELVYANNTFTNVAEGNGITVTISAEQSANYNAASKTVQITVSKADYDMSGVSFENKTVTYDGTTQTISVNGTLPTGADGVQVTVTYGAGRNGVGSTVVTATFATESGNYNVPAAMNATLTITAKQISVSGMTAADKVYDGTANATVSGGELEGVVAGDEVSFDVTSSAFADKNAGENKSVTVTVDLIGADADNYALAEVSGLTATVTAKEIAVVWSNTELSYNGTAQKPTAAADTGIEGESVTLEVSGAAVEVGKHTATATVSEPDGNYVLTNATVEYEIVRKDVIAQFTVGYGTIGVSADGGTQGIEYRVDGGAWTVLPENGVINVDLEASWTIALRYEGDTQSVSHVIYTSSANVVTYLNENLSDNAIENKEIIATAETWLATAVGDKTEANEKVEQAKAAYETALGLLEDSVENALKATANLTSRAVAATVAVAAVSVFGLAVGAVALRRKGGKKNENK